MEQFPAPTNNSRIGFHYFPDENHYRQEDLQAWLPELTKLGASWLTLAAPRDKAIPEAFLRGLIEAGIEPVLQFNLSLTEPIPADDFNLLTEIYQRWGVHYIGLFDKPNSHTSWPPTAWAQVDLVQRFLDLYLPLAEGAADKGLWPLFPALTPGGDYWDTAFLRAALQAIRQRGQEQLLERLVLSAYAWTHGDALDWGAGGPERWPGARPYYTPDGEQDQRGFYIFDWYSAISEAVLGKKLPVMLFEAGALPAAQRQTEKSEEKSLPNDGRQLQIAQLMAGEAVIEGEAELPAVPEQVLAANYWLLAASADHSQAAYAWYQADGSTQPAVTALAEWVQALANGATGQAQVADEVKAEAGAKALPTIEHYLWLPSYEWGVSDWHLEVIRSFVKKHKPTIGFSFEQARLAARVTVIGGEQDCPEEQLNELRSQGCVVRRIDGDGTSIATQLADLSR